MNEVIVSLERVTKRFGALTALDNLDLTLTKGQSLALLGPNGAGKTTAVRLMLGLTKPSAGRVRLFGRHPLDRQARQRVGVMLQVSKVPETLTVAEHLQLCSSYYSSPMPRQQVLAAAGLEGLERRPFGRLSGGQQQRLMFALAICGGPDLIVLDEPTVGLDVESRRSCWREIRRLASEGRSLLLTTHYLEEADAISDRVVLLRGGKLIADGTPEQIKAAGARRQIRCVTQIVDGELQTIPGVTAMVRDRDRVCLTVTDAESVVRALLARDDSLSQLEIANASLEEAFIALTSHASQSASLEEVMR